jgi:hypothetical protein
MHPFPDADISPETDIEVAIPTTAGKRDKIERPTIEPKAIAPKTSEATTSEPTMIAPKTIIVSRSDGSDSIEWESYSQADAALQQHIANMDKAERLHLHVVVVFRDLFVWRSSVSLTREDATGENFVQRAIQADWEFNAGVRPGWWPADAEAERIWGVHYREDRDNGRAELARMRLERYDLTPVVLASLPPRDSPSE